MARILGIDYGTKRIGMALSDERGMMAFPYGVFDISGKTPDQIFQGIATLCSKEQIEKIVIGVPRGLSTMQDTEMTDKVFSFADGLKKLTIPVFYEEEFLSSKQAQRGSTAKQHIDASAAALILQSYLDRKKDMLK